MDEQSEQNSNESQSIYFDKLENSLYWGKSFVDAWFTKSHLWTGICLLILQSLFGWGEIVWWWKVYNNATIG